MKRILFIISLMITSLAVLAQQAPKKEVHREDQLMLDFNWGTLLGKPDSIKIGAASWGFGMKIMLDNPVPKSNVSFAVGLGLGVHNYYSDAEIVNIYQGTDSTYSYFSPIINTRDYKRNKFTMTYFDIPAEIRYRTKPNEKGYSWKVAVGGQVGYLLSSKSKIIENSKKYKGFDYPNMEDWRVGLNARVGYGKVSVNAFYSLSSIFDVNKGAQHNPFSIGITLMPF